MKIFRGIFFAILTFSVLAIAIHQNPSNTVRFVNVTGTGTTTVVPDSVRLSATLTARTKRLQTIGSAKLWHIDTSQNRSAHDRRTFWHSNFSIINSQRNLYV